MIETKHTVMLQERALKRLLWDAVVEDNVAVVRELARAGMDVMQWNSTGETTLREAVWHGAKKVARYLLRGASPEYINYAPRKQPTPEERSPQCTALARAAQRNHRSMVKLLLSHGADPLAAPEGLAQNCALLRAYHTLSAGEEIHKLLEAAVPRIPTGEIRNALVDVSHIPDDGRRFEKLFKWLKALMGETWVIEWASRHHVVCRLAKQTQNTPDPRRLYGLIQKLCMMGPRGRNVSTSKGSSQRTAIDYILRTMARHVGAELLSEAHGTIYELVYRGGSFNRVDPKLLADVMARHPWHIAPDTANGYGRSFAVVCDRAFKQYPHEMTDRMLGAIVDMTAEGPETKLKMSPIMWMDDIDALLDCIPITNAQYWDALLEWVGANCYGRNYRQWWVVGCAVIRSYASRRKVTRKRAQHMGSVLRRFMARLATAASVFAEQQSTAASNERLEEIGMTIPATLEIVCRWDEEGRIPQQDWSDILVTWAAKLANLPGLCHGSPSRSLHGPIAKFPVQWRSLVKVYRYLVQRVTTEDISDVLFRAVLMS